MRRSALLALVALLALIAGIASAGPPAEMPQGSDLTKYESIGVDSMAACPALAAIVISHDTAVLMDNGPAAPAYVVSHNQNTGICDSREVVGIKPHRVLVGSEENSLYSGCESEGAVTMKVGQRSWRTPGTTILKI